MEIVAGRAALDLFDWRRRVAAIYERVRATSDPHAAWRGWRAERDRLFATHPQSPLTDDARPSFEGLAFFAYDPAARVLGHVEPAESEHLTIPTSGDRPMGFTRVARVAFDLLGRRTALDAYWLDGYAGGLFVPFRDTTGGAETYGAGRYLIDTAKGADLGSVDDRLVLDFNFAYNPSCAYNPRWVCPLAPPANRLDLAVRAGEKAPSG